MRLVHLSDLHLGFRAYPQNERGWNRRERDLSAAFRWALQETIRLTPDLILITGDLFDDPNPPSTAFLTIHRGMSHLRTHLPDVPVLIIAGERDTPANIADPGSVAVLDALPGVEAAASAPRAVRFRRLGLHALLVPFRAAAQPPVPDILPDSSAQWNVLLVRGEPSSIGPGIHVDPSEWSYVAVGGDHQSRAWTTNTRTAGSLERPESSPWGASTAEKGFLSFDLKRGASDFHAVPGRPVVDLAPVRVESGDPDAGTRRLRDLLKGVPGGIEGKIVRVRLRGDVIAPNEGVSQGLLDALRRRAAHVEVHVQSREAAFIPRCSAAVWTADEIRVPGLSPSLFSASDRLRGITLFTAASQSARCDIADALRGQVGDERRESGFLKGLGIAPSLPTDPVASALWGGGSDATVLLQTVLPALVDHDLVAARSEPSVQTEAPDATRIAASLDPKSIRSMELELTDRRADWVEASGDLEVSILQWAQDRQDAESKLQAHRERAEELRGRIRVLEAEGQEADCPTCGRTLGHGSPKLLDTLHGEWENLVQDGRWWKRRREQLDRKPEELQTLEEHPLRLQVHAEEAAEALERIRERRRGLIAGESNRSPNSRNAALLDSTFDSQKDPDLREVLRLAGSLLSRITEGRIVGVTASIADLRIVGADGLERPPKGFEAAALRLGIHLALWLRSRSKSVRSDALLIWELHEAGTKALFRGALEVLSDDDQFPVPILMIAPPSILERAPELFHEALDLAEDDQGRWMYRRTTCLRPQLRLGGGEV